MWMALIHLAARDVASEAADAVLFTGADSRPSEIDYLFQGLLAARDVAAGRWEKMFRAKIVRQMIAIHQRSRLLIRFSRTRRHS